MTEVASIDILSIDTAGLACSIGYYCAQREECFSETQNLGKGYAEHLMPQISRVLKKADRTYKDLGKIVVTNGPGGFTGLRVGLSVAKSLAMALDIPVLGVSVPQALAEDYFSTHTLGGDEVLCSVLDTKRGDYYIQFFDGVSSEDEIYVLTGAAFNEYVLEHYDSKKMILLGDGAKDIKTTCDTLGALDIYHCIGYEFSDPKVLCAFAVTMHSLSKQDYKTLGALYIRPADISKPKYKLREVGSIS